MIGDVQFPPGLYTDRTADTAVVPVTPDLVLVRRCHGVAAADDDDLDVSLSVADVQALTRGCRRRQCTKFLAGERSPTITNDNEWCRIRWCQNAFFDGAV